MESGYAYNKTTTDRYLRIKLYTTKDSMWENMDMMRKKNYRAVTIQWQMHNGLTEMD